MNRSRIVQAQPGFRWQGVRVAEYKPDGARHREITRQALLGETPADSGAVSALRYFELQPAGYSSLERHEHEHIVVILRGEGHVILGDTVEKLRLHDCVYVAPNTLHQFHATGTEPLGFLCLVDRVRDRPVAPTPTELEALAANPIVAALMKI